MLKKVVMLMMILLVVGVMKMGPVRLLRLKGKKTKFHRRNRASPFANLEEYECLMNGDMDMTKKCRLRKRKKKTSN